MSDTIETNQPPHPEPEEHHDGEVAPPEPPAAPRHVTARASRRSWAEMPVRVWLVLASAVAVVTIYFTATTVVKGRELRRLLKEGVPIDATILVINGTKDRTIQFKRSDPLIIWVGFKLPNEPNVVGEGSFMRSNDPRERVRVGDPIKIRVDPTDLSPWDKPGMKRAWKWTDRTEPRPWGEEYFVLLLLAPLLAAVGAIALWRRAGVLSIWKSGEAGLARVIGHRHSAVAPRSRVVRFAMAETGNDDDDRRVWHTLHPAIDLPQVGELMWVVYPRGNPGRAVAAKLYE